ncbi:GNAT family N-acetyltransferase [Deinococcus aerius]|uniref:GNAT family N-acetyltransferase n=1 Tax=Deinococcus aerius TaxID=200253 RepID=UPI001914ACAF|nr:GNAT family N-acetyltransferase [Deinococcus aerius]
MRVFFHLNGGTKVVYERYECSRSGLLDDPTFDLPTHLIPRPLRPIGSRFLVEWVPLPRGANLGEDERRQFFVSNTRVLVLAPSGQGAPCYAPGMSRTPRSLGYRTDLALRVQAGAEVEDHGTYTVVRSPANPTFWWGNFLLLHEPPRPGTLEDWQARFREAHPGAAHVTFGMDTADGEAGAAAEFQAAGFRLDRNTVLTTARTTPPAKPLPEGVTLRSLETDADWDAALTLRLAVNAADERPSEEAGYRTFAAQRLAGLRAAQEAGHGAYLGAFLEEQMLAGLGVYSAGGGVTRYQNVETHPDWRSRGLAGHLVHFAGEWARARLGAHTLVIVADPEYHAQRLYERVGFRSTEVQTGLERPPAGG